MKSSRKLPRFIFIASFLCSIHIALLSYINSTMLVQSVGTQGTTFAYVAASALAIIGIALAPLVARRIGARAFLRLVLCVIAVLLALLTAMSGFGSAVVFVLYFACATIVWYAFDLVLEHFSREKSTGNTRGFYLALNNLAWAISPLFASRIITDANIKTPYTVAGTLVALAAFCVYAIPRFSTSAHIPHAKLHDAFRSLVERPRVRRIVALYFLLQFFFALMVINLVPHLIHIGFSWNAIGMILSAMLLPFVLIQYPVGKLADKYHIEGPLIAVGFFIAALFTGALTVSLPQNIIVYAIILFGTRIGAAIIEVAAESAFFKSVKEDDTALISILRMMYPIAYIIAPLCGGLVLLFGTIQTLFTVLAVLLVCAGIYALRVPIIPRTSDTQR